MARSKLNRPLFWYRWNPIQWQASRKVQHMSLAARGLYRELMDECWLKGSVPPTAAGIADLLGFDESEIEPLLAQVIRCFEAVDGSMVSPFIEQVRSEMDRWRLAQAERRLGKDKNGEPRLTPVSECEPQLTRDNHGEPQLTENNPRSGVRVGVGVGDKEGEAKASPKKAAGKHGVYPSEVVQTVNRIGKEVPKTDNRGREIKIVPAVLAERINEIFRTHRWVTPDIAVQSWLDYLATEPEWIKAPHYFFGKQEHQHGGAHWEAYAQLIRHKASRAMQAPLGLGVPA
jgi:hypothetical protein